MSKELLESCDALLTGSKKLICCAAMRAVDKLSSVPVGVTGKELLDWAWQNRHPMTKECTWPEGKSIDVSRMFFQKGKEVGCRLLLPHPIAVVPRGRPLPFNPTIDVNLSSNFTVPETYVITDPSEGAVIELSPPEKEFVMTRPMRDRFDNGGPSNPSFIPITNARHKFFLGHKVIIRGSGGDCGDEEVVERMVK